MNLSRLTGPQTGSQKYDLLTAMAVAGLNGKSGLQTSMLRLVVLVTARYNWKLDEFSVGQRDLARMWSVDQRTVKREIKRLVDSKILLQLRAGVRGRVAAYRLGRQEIYRLSAPHWERVGPDFSARMDEQYVAMGAQKETVVRVDFRGKSSDDDAPQWHRVKARLAETDPVVHSSWFASLRFIDHDNNVLHLQAPSSFVAQYVLTHHLQRLQEAASPDFPGLQRIRITT